MMSQCYCVILCGHITGNRRKEGNVLFNDALNTFYLRLRGSILHGVDPLSYFSFQPVLHDWFNKGRGMYYPVCGMMHIKEPLLLIGKSSPFAAAGFLSRYLSGTLPYV